MDNVGQSVMPVLSLDQNWLETLQNSKYLDRTICAFDKGLIKFY